MKRRAICVLAGTALSLLLALPAHAQGGWGVGPALTTERNEIGAAMANGKVYIAGGAALGKVDSPLLQELDLATGKWRDLAPMPRGGSHVMVVQLNGKLYVAGGFTANVHKDPLDQFLEYDPATNQWRQLAKLSSPRGSVGLVAIGGLIHAIGGRGADGMTVTTHEVFNPATNSWSLKAPLPRARDHLGIAAVDGKIHVFGGRLNATVDNVNEHDVYDPATDKWGMAAPLITSRSAGAAVVYKGQILYYGGECKNPQTRATFDELEAYDPKTDSWKSLPKRDGGLHAASAVADANTAYFIGGTNGCGGDRPSNQIHTFKLP